MYSSDAVEYPCIRDLDIRPFMSFPISIPRHRVTGLWTN